MFRSVKLFFQLHSSMGTRISTGLFDHNGLSFRVSKYCTFISILFFALANVVVSRRQQKSKPSKWEYVDFHTLPLLHSIIQYHMSVFLFPFLFSNILPLFRSLYKFMSESLLYVMGKSEWWGNRLMKTCYGLYYIALYPLVLTGL